MSRALECFQTARVLLADSHDHFLVSQVELFYVSAMRARDVTKDNVDKILARTRKCSVELKKHPEYYIQSLRDLAVAEFSAAQFKSSQDSARDSHLREARRIVEEALALPVCDRRSEYKMLAHALLSRIYRFEGGTSNLKLARSHAEEAYAWGQDKNVGSRALSEAQITLAEYLLTRKKSADWTKAITLLNDAAEACRENLVISCACYLHLTDSYLKTGDIQNALRSFSRWECRSGAIEYGSLKKKAESLQDQINRYKYFLVSEDDDRKIEALTKSLAQFLVDREKRRQGTTTLDLKRAAEKIGIDARTLEKWIIKLEGNEDFNFQFHPVATRRQRKK